MTLDLRWQVSHTNITDDSVESVHSQHNSGRSEQPDFPYRRSKWLVRRRHNKNSVRAGVPQFVQYNSTIVNSYDATGRSVSILELAFRQVGTRANETFILYHNTPTVKFGMTSIGDIKPPTGLTSLNALTGAASAQIILSWSAPGNNGTIGTLLANSRYHIATTTVLTDALDEAYWENKRTNPEIQISTSGVRPYNPQGRVLSGLQDAVTYYIRVWTRDQSGNYSALSRGATAMAQWAARVPETSTFTGVTINTVTVTWGSNNNASNVRYEMQVSSSDDFVPFSSSVTYLLTASSSALVPNTSYYVRVRTYGIAGDTSAFSDTLSTDTLAACRD